MSLKNHICGNEQLIHTESIEIVKAIHVELFTEISFRNLQSPTSTLNKFISVSFCVGPNGSAIVTVQGWLNCPKPCILGQNSSYNYFDKKITLVFIKRKFVFKLYSVDVLKTGL